MLFLSVLILAVFPAHAAVIGGLDWREFSDTVTLSYNDLDGACNATGECSGSVSGINLDGWTWASLDEVVAMWISLTGVDLSSYQGTTTLFAYDGQNTTIPFMETAATGYVEFFTREPLVAGFDAGGYIYDAANYNEIWIYPGYWDYPDRVSGIIGAAMYRSAPTGQAPVPATLALLGLGLCVLGLTQRRKA
jgi:hypothetical protein